MADHSTRTPVREHPGPPPVAAISDDLWNAINRKRPTACREHTAWAEICAPLHQPAGAVAA